MKRLFFVLIIFFAFTSICCESKTNNFSKNQQEELFVTNTTPTYSGNVSFLPTSTKLDVPVYDHKYFTIGYAEKHKQPYYVQWILTREMVRNKVVKRKNDFRRDNSLTCCYSESSDYNRSGYDRGHMCPSGDMTWSKKANSETFLMSNMCPQNQKLNRGKWNDLERLTRSWAERYDSLLVICGPIFTNATKTIGRNKITVPTSFYKIIARIDNGNIRSAVAYIMPNLECKQHINTYTTSIDNIEKLTFLDFFHTKTKDARIEEMERTISKHL